MSVLLVLDLDMIWENEYFFDGLEESALREWLIYRDSHLLLYFPEQFILFYLAELAAVSL